jgi:hypothetical protein
MKLLEIIKTQYSLCYCKIIVRNHYVQNLPDRRRKLIVHEFGWF